MASYLPDGYTEDLYIAEVPGLHEDLRFRVRRMVEWETAEYFKQAARLEGKGRADFEAQLIDARLVDWDLRTPPTREAPQGTAVAKSPAAVTRLPRALFQRLLGICLGIQASDYDPKAAHAGDVPLLPQQAADAKN